MPGRVAKKFLDLNGFLQGVSYHKAFAVTSPEAKDFRHLLPTKTMEFRSINRRIDGQRRRDKLPVLGPLRLPTPKHRIKQWNIVPGDKVGVQGDPEEGKVYEVAAIDRVMNKVLLKDSSGKDLLRDPRDPSSVRETIGHKPVDYWNCLLYLGETPNPEGDEPETVPFFVKRMRKTSPKFDGFKKEWVWKRRAMCTTPSRVPDYKLSTPIPWPARPPREHLPASSLDTPPDVVKRVTYKPPLFSKDSKGLAHLPPTKEAFLYHVMNPRQRGGYDQSRPVEPLLVAELSNEHAKAKKIIRWQKVVARREALLQSLVIDQRKKFGLSMHEAKAHATILWKQSLKDQKKKQRQKVDMARGREEELKKKYKKQAQKADKVSKKLKELSLAAAPNQYLPPSMVQ